MTRKNQKGRIVLGESGRFICQGLLIREEEWKMEKAKILDRLERMKQEISELPDDADVSIMVKCVQGDFFNGDGIHGFGFIFGQPADVAVIMATTIKDVFPFRDTHDADVFFTSLRGLCDSMGDPHPDNSPSGTVSPCDDEEDVEEVRPTTQEIIDKGLN